MIDELLDLDKKLKSITYVIRTEESLHPHIKKFRWVPILHWLTYIVIVNISHIRHCFS